MESPESLVVVGFRAWQAKNENLFSRCRQKDLDNLKLSAILPVLPVATNQPTNRKRK